MYGNGIYFNIVTDNGSKMTQFYQNGRTYIEARDKSNFKIRLQNTTSDRIKVILSVDGLNIISGNRATPNSEGYLINRFETITIDGWRISSQELRKFFFTTKKNSYNAKTGNDTSNIGVIGMLAYREVVNIPFIGYNQLLSGSYGRLSDSMITNCSYSSNSVATSVAELKSTRSLGTGMGEVKSAPVQRVDATWEANPFSNMEIFYKTRRQLENMGIRVIPVREQQVPSAFAGFCKQV